MQARINWVGLAGGLMTIAVVVASFFIPWWRLTADVESQAISLEGLARADVSPLNTNFNLLGRALTVPLLTALNIVGLLSLLASGIVMLIYSVLPTKSYSKHLLGFAYKKPLFMVIFFVASLLAISLIVQSFAGVVMPLSGSGNVPLPENFVGGESVNILFSTGFLLPFWLAIVAAGLCIGARIYHMKFTTASKLEAKPAEPTATKEEAKPTETTSPKEEPKQTEPPAAPAETPPVSTT
jgi:hypothetical protein